MRDKILWFYRNKFDLNILWKVLPKKNFENREFGFDKLFAGFTRNISFEKPEYLKEYLSNVPTFGAYIGSLYKHRLIPKDKYNDAITIHNTPWVGRELIFDLDMDDYDLVRTCKCKGREVCEDCWGLMQDAAAIIDETLDVDFGFKKRVWVYTGGRGYHCWVLDDNVFSVDQNIRSAIVEYMQLIHDPKKMQKIDNIGDHAILLKKRIYQKIGRKFIMDTKTKILTSEGGFTTGKLQKARQILKSSELVSDIIDAIPNDTHDIFLNTLIKYRYPRIDHKVTIDIRRLIRMPGSIHGKTMNISEYVNPINFNPIDDATNINDIYQK